MTRVVRDTIYDVVVVGELNADIILRGDVVPAFGQVEKVIEDLDLCAGSSSAIFAASAARMGLRVRFISKVGDDTLGHYLLGELETAGLSPEHVIVDPSVKTGATVHLSTGQDRAMLTYLGSIAAITASDLPSDWLESVRHLHVASPFLLQGLRPQMPAMMDQARQAKRSVSLDTNWDPAEGWYLGGFFDDLDLFLPNEQELLAITGESDLMSGLRTALQLVPLVVVKRGERGALAATASELVEVPAYDVAVVDTTGAGDTFDGGFVAPWLREEPLERCLALASACGALTSTQAGGFHGQPTWDEARALVEAEARRATSSGEEA
jgi:sugar/nucleoside kinase (ribokinase family)